MSIFKKELKLDDLNNVEFSGTTVNLSVREDDVSKPIIIAQSGIDVYNNKKDLFLTTNGRAELIVPRKEIIESININATDLYLEVSDVLLRTLIIKATSGLIKLDKLRLQELRAVLTHGDIYLSNFNSVDSNISVVDGTISAEILNYYQNYKMSLPSNADLTINNDGEESEFNDVFLNEFKVHNLAGQTRVLFK